MQDISASVSQIVNNIDKVQNQMNQQADGVQKASNAMNQILDNIKSLNSNIDSQSAAVREMVANIQSVTNILEKNEQSTKQLGDASEIGKTKIKESVELSQRIMADSSGLMDASRVIQTIANRTNPRFYSSSGCNQEY